MQSAAGPRAALNEKQPQELRKLLETVLAAFTAYREGRHADVQSLCRQVLEEWPDGFDAMHLLGVSVLDCERYEEARGILEGALALNPSSADVHSNLGFALLRLGRCDEACAAYEKAIALKPDFPLALKNLGNALFRLERAEPAIAAFTRAVALDPADVESLCNRGVAEMMLKRYDAALVSYERTLALQPDHFEAMAGRAFAHLELRHFDEAEATFDAALAIKPDDAELLAHRARLYFQMGRTAKAEADYNAAAALAPSLEAAWKGKVLIGINNGRLSEAIASCKKVLEQNPRSDFALTWLGVCYGRLGDMRAAIEHYDRALAIKPDSEEAITKKIFHLDFHPEADFAVQQAARKSWWDMIGAKLPRRTLASRPLDANKRLVIGYVSSDFRFHSAAFAFLPVVRSHDKTSFQINCYSSSLGRDHITSIFQSLADVWVDAANLSDDELADRIQADGVDILVDLSGHSAGGRLNVFARKPAPVQVTAWGHATGTGLQTMDYFFADPVTIPQDVRHLFAERVHDLPSLITMEPVFELVPSPLPMLRNGYVTFGVFNRIDKISDEALAVWSKVLDAVPGSKIVVKHFALGDAFRRDSLIGRFVAHGVAQDRVICLGTSDRGEHLRAFDDIDISLDPFPQNGGISTWESLYLGVPVVARLGHGAASRIGGALLNALGLDDWVASDSDGYVAIAQKYAAMPEHLAKLRADLPGIIASSAAGNIAIYTERVEAGYRQFWRDYCAANA